MSEMAIQVKDLSKVYKLYNKPSDRLKETLGFHVDAREHYALKHVNFEIRKGETVGIIGQRALLLFEYPLILANLTARSF